MKKKTQLRKAQTIAKLAYLLLPIVLTIGFAFICREFYNNFLRLNNSSTYSGAIIGLIFIFLGLGFLTGLQTGLIKKALTSGMIAMIVAVVPFVIIVSVSSNYQSYPETLYFFASFVIGISTVSVGLLLTIFYYLAIKKSHFSFAKVANIIMLVVMVLSIVASAFIIYQQNPYSNGSIHIYRTLRGLGGYATQNSNIHYSFAYSTDKLARTEDLPNYEEFDIKLAKNEWESLQLVVVSRIDTTTWIEVSPFTNAAGESLYTMISLEHYVDLPLPEKGKDYQYPDALIPITKDTAVMLESNLLQAFFIETRTLKTSSAGEYTATVTMRDKNGIILEKKISATVWDFTLPDTHYSNTAVGLDTRSSMHELGIATPTFYPDNEDNMELGYGYNTWKYFYDGTINLAEYPEVEALYKASYDYLLEHGLSSNFLPYDLLDTRVDEDGILLVDKYLDDPRVTTFCIPYPRDDDEKLLAYYNKATSKPEWAKKAYFYPVDEPMDIYRKQSYDEIVARLNRLLGEDNYNMITPMCEMVSIDWYTGEPINQFELQKKDNTWICAQTYFYFNEEYVDEITHLAEDENKTAWWYVCNGPTEKDGYCNLFVEQESIKHRILFWQQYDYDVDGFLYYFANVWTERGSGNPWDENDIWATAVSGYGITPNGDGILIYPGADIGTPYTPAATIRLKNVTAGLEDYDYLKMAEEKLGRIAVNEIVDKVTLSLTDYTTEHEVLESIRREIGDLLSK